MINLITKQNAGVHGDLLARMFRQRYRVFKEKLGWDVEHIDGKERDEFDRPDTAYLIASDNSGRIEGSWRLLPTTRPYMASTVFPQLFDGQEPPISTDIWECSRFAIDPFERRMTSAGVDATTASLFVAIIEFAVTYGVREIVTVEDIALARLVRRAFDMRPVWRGSVHRLGTTRAVLARYEIDGVLLAKLRAKFEAPAPIIKQLALWDQPEAA
jgi:acyl homoserine lactone synthase